MNVLENQVFDFPFMLHFCNLRVPFTKFGCQFGAPVFKISLESAVVIFSRARPIAKFRDRDAVEREPLDHVLHGIVLKPGQQDLTFDTRTSFGCHLVQAL
ncbi:MAG: hypothetical protein DDT34_02169 [Firmicutes bacterium]|nr:hypothetical protein [Bacillota bacterium]